MTRDQYAAEVRRRAATMADSMVATGRVSVWNLHAFLLRDAASSAQIGAAVDSLLDGPGLSTGASNAGGPFHVLPLSLLLRRWERQLPDAVVARIRRFFTDGVIDRGNTENHWLMHYTGNLLAAERWPDAEHMWNGLSPQAVRAEARRWILGTIDRTVLVGHYEYDSTGYIAEHVTPLIGLAEHAADELVRAKAGSALALLFADMAVEYFHGAWAGGHSREGYRVNTWTKSGTVRGLHFLYFGGEDHDPAAHDQAFVAPNLAADYLPPPMLRDIAFDRATPFVVKKTRAPRAVYRHVDREPAPVRKYTYMSRSFALGTTQLGLPGAPAGPIDLTSWDLSWDAPKHQGKITCNHPYTDPRRFSAFLPVVPQAAGRDIATDKPYLQWQDRLFGACPFERMMQHEATALVFYRLPADDRNPYLNIYLPKALTWHEEDGWLFADAGPFYIALRVVGAYGWEEIRESVHANIMVRDGDLIDGWLLRVDSRLGGLAIECVEADTVDSFAAYRDQRCVADVALGRWRSEAVVGIDTWDGHHLQLDYHGDHCVDGQPIDYGAYPLLSAPWVDAPLGSGRVRFARGAQTMELDFGIDATTELIPMRVIG